MSNNVLKGKQSGLYFVQGKGFIARTQNEATRLCNETAVATQECAARFGQETSTIEEVANVSWAPVYIRGTDKVSLTGVTKNPAQPNLGQVDPSKRRFATFKEAAIHAGRFYVRRARRTDAKDSGTAGHVGAFVVETNDPVNSSVNPETGLSNWNKQ